MYVQAFDEYWTGKKKRKNKNMKEKYQVSLDFSEPPTEPVK